VGSKGEHLLSIVVPVFNEEESLEDLHAEIADALKNTEGYADSYEMILVDDGSTDRSFDVCCTLHERDPEHVRVIRLRRNFGQTAAIAAGFDASVGDVILPMDADLQNDPTDIPKLVAKVDEGYDVVSGWRVDRKDTFWSRTVPSAIANWLISWITGVRLHDYGCTLKAYRGEVAKELHPYGEMHRFLPALASWSGASVTEVEVNHRARKHGRSKYGFGRTLRVLLDLLTVKFLLSFSTKPMQVFGRLGMYSFLVGILAGLFAIALKIVKSEDITGNPWMYICMFFMLGGLQFLGLGLLGEINVRTYYESQQKPIYTIREIRGRDSGQDVADR